MEEYENYENYEKKKLNEENQDNVETQNNNEDEKEVNLNTKNYLSLGKNQIDGETNFYKYLKVVEMEGKEVLDKKTNKKFWSGLKTSSEERLPARLIKLIDDNNIISYFNLNWEGIYKIKTFQNFLISKKDDIKNGWEINIKRIAAGGETAGKNFIFYFRRSDELYEVVGTGEGSKKKNIVNKIK